MRFMLQPNRLFWKQWDPVMCQTQVYISKPKSVKLQTLYSVHEKFGN